MSNTATAPVLIENIPDDMRKEPRCIVWRFETVDGRENQKVPRRPVDGNFASSTDPADRTDFATALNAYESGNYSGLGFVLGDGWAGIDLDDCLNDSGLFTWGGEIVDAFASYAEVSPSGTGVKIFIRGKKPAGSGCSKKGFGPDKTGKLEVYDHGRYFTVTGQIIEGKPTAVVDCQTQLDSLCKKYLTATAPPPTSGRTVKPTGDDNRVERCRAYVAKLPPAISGQSGHDATFHAAAECFRFGLTESEALAEMEIFNARCVPPWSDRELAHKIQSAKANVNGDFGCRLREENDTPRRRSTNTTSAGPTDAQTEANGASSELILDPSNPMPTAEIFLQDFYLALGIRRLFCSGDTFYAWNNRIYAEVRAAELKAQLYQWLANVKRLKGKDGELAPFAPNRNNVANIVEALAAITHTQIVPPAWIEGDGPDPRELIIAGNGIVHLKPDGPAFISKPTPRLFALNCLEFEYHHSAPRPARWHKFLRQLWPDNPDSVEVLQMWFGYCLVADTRQQKALMLVGPKRSGKGTICRILTKLIGSASVCGPTLSGLATNFGLWSFIGKLLAVVSDARLSGKADQAIIVERLLALTGEDALTIDRKNLEPITVRLATRLMLVSNELPKLSDASGALASRFIILQLSQSFYGQEDTQLEECLTLELPGILLWAIEGWQKLQANRCFKIPQSSVDAVSEMEDLASPVKAFIRDCCKLSPSAEIPVGELYDGWCWWCELEGRPAGSKGVFGRDLHAAESAIHVAQRRDDSDKRQRMYEGVRLSIEAAESSRVWAGNRDKKRGVNNE